MFIYYLGKNTAIPVAVMIADLRNDLPYLSFMIIKTKTTTHSNVSPNHRTKNQTLFLVQPYPPPNVLVLLTSRLVLARTTV